VISTLYYTLGAVSCFDRGPAGCGRARAAWCSAGPPCTAAVASARARLALAAAELGALPCKATTGATPWLGASGGEQRSDTD
jgi:hypothetical protein